ncbi:hypothetical protein JRQ81_004811 [Phrynocephalus forsythii]|uniref:Protein KTI12 homolog n=1 Tax=Phrynocephalus forsythii TaxID=171643 RepID=A0A9Q0Y290_9SAUR|nr:hypothetical protein JRQ81_004811 [Phrynocephalus forsythii]
MPLVLLCGLPGSGKSRRAEELRAALSADGGDGDGDGDGPPRRVFVVSEADFLGDGGGGRSALRAETERLLSRRDVVIVDAGSELKSFRYELYCLCKQAGTPHCLLFCPGGAACPDRPPLEPPDPGRHRWDWPLFAAPTSADEALPLAEIRAALFQRPPPPPHRSTRAEPLQAAGFLHQLDRLTQDVLAALMAAQRQQRRRLPARAVRPRGRGGTGDGRRRRRRRRRRGPRGPTATAGLAAQPARQPGGAEPPAKAVPQLRQDAPGRRGTGPAPARQHVPAVPEPQPPVKKAACFLGGGARGAIGTQNIEA